MSESHPASSAESPGSSPAPASLDTLRRAIDDVDARLVDALSERARLVVEVGKLKRGGAAPVYVPHREQEVLAKVLARNPGPLPGRTLEAVFRELMSGSFALELGLRVGYLGPEGSFSHLAAVRPKWAQLLKQWREGRGAAQQAA